MNWLVLLLSIVSVAALGGYIYLLVEFSVETVLATIAVVIAVICVMAAYHLWMGVLG